MFYYVYILQSLKDASLYIGYTNDLKRRVKQHNSGLDEYTKKYMPWKLIHYEAYLNEKDAKRREKYLKTSQGGRLLKRMLKEYFYEQKLKFSYKINMKKIIFLFFIFCFLISGSALAAEIYLESSQIEYAPNETFSVDIRLNVIPPEDINAVEVYLSFPKDILEAVDFSTANSILTFIKNPVINQQNGLINFSGIVPGGYTGRLTGDPGKSNLLGKAIFKVKKQEKETTLISSEARKKVLSEAKVLIKFLENSQVLLNDGKGTKANLTFLPLEIKISSQEVVFNPLNDWERIKEEDKTPPEEFKPEVVKIDDKYFLVFNSRDKQSGIDRYEIQTLKENLFGQLVPISNFEKGESPYPLKESDLNKTIEVKAVDKSGNERIATLNLQVPIKWYKIYWLWSIIIIIVLVRFAVWRLFKSKIKHQNSK